MAWRQTVELPPLLTPGADVLGTTTTADGRELVVVHDPAEDGHRITSHDAATGELVATTMLPLGSQPLDLSLADGLLAHRDLTTVTLVDVATGQRRWRVEQRLRGDTQVTSAGVVGVRAETTRTDVTLLAAADGSPVWATRVAEQGLVTTIVEVGQTIVVAVEDTDSPQLVGLDPATGAVQWRLGSDDLPARESFPQAPISATDRHVLVPSTNRTILVDATDGSITQVLPLAAEGGGPGASPDPGLPVAVASIGAGAVVISDGQRTVQAISIDGADPARLWSVTRPGPTGLRHRGPRTSTSPSAATAARRCWTLPAARPLPRSALPVGPHGSRSPTMVLWHGWRPTAPWN